MGKWNTDPAGAGRGLAWIEKMNADDADLTAKGCGSFEAHDAHLLSF
jgi:hypothetical protein